MATKKNGSTGRRYSEAERKNILAFVESHGRGGITKAKEKFGVSYVALKRWMDAEGTGTRTGKNESSVQLTKIKGLKGILGLIRRTEENLAGIKARIAAL